MSIAAETQQLVTGQILSAGPRQPRAAMVRAVNDVQKVLDLVGAHLGATEWVEFDQSRVDRLAGAVWGLPVASRTETTSGADLELHLTVEGEGMTKPACIGAGRC